MSRKDIGSTHNSASLIRIETMIEISQGKRIPGIDILPDLKDGDS
jgi:hypothetical protein